LRKGGGEAKRKKRANRFDSPNGVDDLDVVLLEGCPEGQLALALGIEVFHELVDLLDRRIVGPLPLGCRDKDLAGAKEPEGAPVLVKIPVLFEVSVLSKGLYPEDPQPHELVGDVIELRRGKFQVSRQRRQQSLF